MQQAPTNFVSMLWGQLGYHVQTIPTLLRTEERRRKKQRVEHESALGNLQIYEIFPMLEKTLSESCSLFSREMKTSTEGWGVLKKFYG